MELGVTGESFVDLVARRVVELLRAEGLAGPGRPLSCAEVAARLGRSTDWVRSHRDELGVLPAEGSRPRLMFDAQAVDEWATARSSSVRSEVEDLPAALADLPHRARPVSGDGRVLLPVGRTRRV